MTEACIDLQRIGAVARIVIHNPAKRNALTSRMWKDLRSTIESLSADPAMRCLVITGAGDKAFAAGADIEEFPDERMNRAQVTRYHEEIVGPALDAIVSSDLVSIAAIKGDCMGGGLEIAAACDLRHAVPEARFGAAVARLGFPLAFGETELLVRKYGFPLAAEILLECRLLDAWEVYAKGFVGRIVPRPDFDEEIAATAARIAALSPVALRGMKQQMRRLLRDATPVTQGERAQHYGFAETDDYREGYAAFIAKRPPRFNGL